MSKTLSSLLERIEYNIKYLGAYAHDDIPNMIIPAVVSDERKLSKGCLFICCRITNYNGPPGIIIRQTT